jgi:glucosylceramidase
MARAAALLGGALALAALAASARADCAGTLFPAS